MRTCIDLNGGTDAGEQRQVRIGLIKLQADRQSLDNFHPIAGSILRRQDREIRPCAGTHADNMRLERPARISINVDRRFFAWAHMGQIGFAEIRLDPDALTRQQPEHGRAGIDEVADLQIVDPRHDAVLGCDNRRVGQIEAGPVELRFCRTDRGMADRSRYSDHRSARRRWRRSAVRLRQHAAGQFEIRPGAVKHNLRSRADGGERIIASIVALVETHGILGRLEVSLLLPVSRFQCGYLQPRVIQLRFGLSDRDLVWCRIELEQKLALVDRLIVLDGNIHHLAGNPGVKRLLRRADVSIVCRRVGRLRRDNTPILQRPEGAGKWSTAGGAAAPAASRLGRVGGGGRGSTAAASGAAPASSSCSTPALSTEMPGGHRASERREIGLHGEPHGG